MKKTIIISSIILFILIVLDYNIVISPCLNLAQNTKQSFQIAFHAGSSDADLNNFTKDFTDKYTNSVIEKIITDKQYIDEILKTSNLTDIKKIDEIKSDLIKRGIPVSSVNIKASVNDLGKLNDFKDFLDTEFTKFRTLKFKQFTGYTPEQFLAPEVSALSYCISPSLILKIF